MCLLGQNMASLCLNCQTDYLEFDNPCLVFIESPTRFSINQVCILSHTFLGDFIVIKKYKINSSGNLEYMPDRVYHDLSHLSVATKSKLSLEPHCQLLRAG